MTTICTDEAMRAAMAKLKAGTAGEGSEDDAPDSECKPNRDRRRAVKEALAEIAKSDAHLEAICAALLRACRFFPTTAEVWSIGQATDPPVKNSAARENCPECKGSGWVTTQMIGSGVFGSLRYGAVKHCPCRRLSA